MESRTNRRWLQLRRLDEGWRRERGFQLLCGVDEAGRGPLAGPVVAAAVVLAPRASFPGLDDSKALPAEVREALAARVRERSAAFGVSVVGPRSIERFNILRASHIAMRRAVTRAGRRSAIELVLVDGNLAVPDLAWPQEAIVDGDAKSLAIAAASVIAKTVRDRIMNTVDRWYPQYGFARHKGYATAEHLEALEAHGPCPWHRFSFSPVSQGDLFPLASR